MAAPSNLALASTSVKFDAGEARLALRRQAISKRSAPAPMTPARSTHREKSNAGGTPHRSRRPCPMPHLSTSPSVALTPAPSTHLTISTAGAVTARTRRAPRTDNTHRSAPAATTPAPSTPPTTFFAGATRTEFNPPIRDHRGARKQTCLLHSRRVLCYGGHRLSTVE